MDRRRLTRLFAAPATLAAVLLAVACSPGSGTTASTPADSPSREPTLQQLAPLFMQCLLDRKVTIWDRAEGDINMVLTGTREGWYRNGRVVANQAFYADFDSIEGTTPVSPAFKPEQDIASWLGHAAATGTWPKTCGPFPRAR